MSRLGKTAFLTLTARKKLARRTATAAFGKNPSPKQIGDAGKAIDEIVNADPNRFIDFSNAAYCTPKHDAIIEAASEKLNPQTQLF